MIMKKFIYVKFCEYSDDGLSYRLISQYMNEHYADDTDYTFLSEIDLPEVSRETITAMGVKCLDKKIAEENAKSYRAIEGLKAKKEQLVALTHDGME